MNIIDSVIIIILVAAAINGFVKGFFDRFYINVRYSQSLNDTSAQTAQTSQTFINYELTYKLTHILSISYYREPISLNDVISGYYKTSLSAQYVF